MGTLGTGLQTIDLHQHGASGTRAGLGGHAPGLAQGGPEAAAPSGPQRLPVWPAGQASCQAGRWAGHAFYC